MAKYKIKSLLENSIIVEYRTPNGSLKELYIGIEAGWDRKKIEEEIALQKKLADKRDINIDLSQYFFKGEEIEFVDVPTEEERMEEMDKKFEEEQKRLEEEENQKFLNKVLEYRNTEVDYKQVRWYLYPSTEEQLDALYWMRKGVMEPIQEIDRRIEEAKQQYPKDQPTNLTCGDLDSMFSEQRPTDYLYELKSRNIQTDFL